MEKINHFDNISDELLQHIFLYFCDNLSKTMLFFTSTRLQKLICKKIKNKNRICHLAAKIRSLNILKWAHENGCCWDKYTSLYAVENGDLEMLKWAHENNCPWSGYDCHMSARKNNHDEIIEWIIKNNNEIMVLPLPEGGSITMFDPFYARIREIVEKGSEPHRNLAEELRLRIKNRQKD